MPAILSSVPPTPSFVYLKASPSPPFHDCLTAATSAAKLTPLACTTPRKKAKRKQDDYHSTLEALNSKGRFPRKSLGQHYMLNASINEELAAAANVKEGDIVLEIGPGTGSLTNVLVNAGATVLAIEKDPYMAALVRERFAGIARVKVVEEDFTRSHVLSHMSSLLPSESPSDEESFFAKVVANLPFNISTDVVKKLLPMGDIFSEVILLLQVDAAVISFKLKQSEDYPHVSSIRSFFSMVNSAFNGKRKMLRKSLQHICSPPDIEAALCNAGLPATSRPEELTLEDFVKLHNLIVKT
ncbi:ribosomal RNA small subunit methyltransferase, chloroplastic isoform X2 [Henckelia pumila]|uniref:ribosomal RNA small subunit methyltransferase, chloroplastic isoform X2 n=1 Tax=Henckelia pumila TaxID=405737 RepID=UPI003C6DEFB7